MKNTWRAMAAILAMLIGISGAAFGQNRQQQPASNMRTAPVQQERAPQTYRPAQPQRPAQFQPAQQPQRTQAPPQRPDNDRNGTASTQGRRTPVPVNNRFPDRNDHGRPPVVVVQQPVYAAPDYGYYGYDDAYVAPADYAVTAQQVGFQDGVNDGHNDWVMGFGFRSGYDNNYVNADNGYNPDFGSLLGYQAAYRIAYQQGYTQGYGH